MTLHGMPGAFDRVAEVDKIYSGSAQADGLLARIKPGWIVVGPMERIEFTHLNAAYIARISDPVLSEGPWELRRIRPEVLPHADRP